MKKKLFFLLLSISGFSQIDKVEPPFWWSNMHNPDLQIMFYGKNIAQNEVYVSNSIIIKEIQKTENPNYIFVTIDTKNVTVADFVFTFTNKNKSFTQNYSLKARRENLRLRENYDASDVIYLLMPNRFANGNTSNDSDKSVTKKYNRELPGGRHGGDIEEIIKNINYLSELGANAVWSTPLCEDNDEKYSYQTYGQSDVYKIDPFTQSDRNKVQEQYFSFTSKLLNWRKNKTVIHAGNTTHYIPENNVYVYFRYNDNESVMVVINNSNEKQAFKTNRFQENISNYKSGKDIFSNTDLDLKMTSQLNQNRFYC